MLEALEQQLAIALRVARGRHLLQAPAQPRVPAPQLVKLAALERLRVIVPQQAVLETLLRLRVTAPQRVGLVAQEQPRVTAPQLVMLEVQAQPRVIAPRLARGASLATSTGTTTGDSTATGQAGSVGTATGDSTASGAGSSLVVSTATASGDSTASGQAGSAGATSGDSTASGQVGSTATALGDSAACAVGSYFVEVSVDENPCPTNGLVDILETTNQKLSSLQHRPSQNLIISIGEKEFATPPCPGSGTNRIAQRLQTLDGPLKNPPVQSGSREFELDKTENTNTDRIAQRLQVLNGPLKNPPVQSGSKEFELEAFAVLRQSQLQKVAKKLEELENTQAGHFVGVGEREFTTIPRPSNKTGRIAQRLQVLNGPLKNQPVQSGSREFELEAIAVLRQSQLQEVAKKLEELEKIKVGCPTE